jgi:hypothetical protein
MITRLAAPGSAMASVQRCLRPRRWATPREWVVRSDRAPAIGVASTEATAPSADTTPSAASLCRGVMSWSWIGSSTCSGV